MENTCTEKSVKAAPDTQYSKSICSCHYKQTSIAKAHVWNQGTLYFIMHLCRTHSFEGQLNTDTHTRGAGRTGWTWRPDLDFMVWHLL